MQGYISKNASRPGTATQRGVQGSRMQASRMQGSKMPASQPSNQKSPPMKMTKSRGIDWSDMARRLPTSKTDPAQIKMRAEYWKGFDNNGNGGKDLTTMAMDTCLWPRLKKVFVMLSS